MIFRVWGMVFIPLTRHHLAVLLFWMVFYQFPGDFYLGIVIFLKTLKMNISS